VLWVCLLAAGCGGDEDDEAPPRDQDAEERARRDERRSREPYRGGEDGPERGTVRLVRTRPAEPPKTSPEWPDRYRYESTWDLPGALSMVVRDVHKDDSNVVREVDWPADVPNARAPDMGGDLLADTPGSEDIRIEIVDPPGQTRYAGLTFTSPCVLSLGADGTLHAASEGVTGVDDEGYAWRSRELIREDRPVIVFLRDGRAQDAQR